MNIENVEPVETITIDWQEFEKAFRQNYLEPPEYHSDHNHVLRLYPPFETEMTAEHYRSENGAHYPNDMNPKPVHLLPRMLVEIDKLIVWPTKANTKDTLTDEEIEDIGGIDEAVKEGREIFWDELKHHFLKDTVDLYEAMGSPERGKKVDINWVGIED